MLDTTRTPAKSHNKATKKPSHEAVLEFLRTYSDPRSGQCTPSNKEIAAAVGLTPGTVSHITTKLVKSGRIEKTAGWEYRVDGRDWVFTTDRWEAEANAQRADHYSGSGDWTRGPNLFKVVGVLLLLVVLWPTVCSAGSMSVYEALCYKSAIAVLFAHLLNKYFPPSGCRRLEAF